MFWCASVIYLLLFLNGVYGEGWYRVVGGASLRPGSEYHVSVSVEGVSVATSVTVGVVGRSKTGRPLALERQVVVEPYGTRVVRLDVAADLADGEYRLVARGAGGLAFDARSAPLRYVAHALTVLVQTDRATYAPGDLIRMRAFALDPLALRSPASPHRAAVRVLDPHGRIISSWLVNLDGGAPWAGELRLADEPPLGDWTVSIEELPAGAMHNRTVRVLETRAPRLVVRATAPRRLPFSAGELAVVVRATWPRTGESVAEGIVTVTAYPTIVSGVIQPLWREPARRVLRLKAGDAGRAEARFRLGDDLRLGDEYERTVRVDVTVEEALTGRSQNTSLTVQLHKYAHRLYLVNTADCYKPGLPYTAYVRVAAYGEEEDRGDRRATAAGGVVRLRHGWAHPGHPVDYEEREATLDARGVAELTVRAPSTADNRSLWIEAVYGDVREWFTPVPPATSPSGNYVRGWPVTTAVVAVNEDIEVLFELTEPVRQVAWQVWGRGDVLLARAEILRGDALQHRVHFTATRAMAPTCRLVVSYVRATGELVADALDLRVAGLMRDNEVRVDVEAATWRPGDEVGVIIRARPASWVGVLAVPEREGSPRTRRENDVTMTRLLEELARVDPTTATEQRFPWKPGSANAHQLIRESGMVLLTNSAINKDTPTLDEVYVRPRDADENSVLVKTDRGPGVSLRAGRRPALAGPYAFSRIPAPADLRPRLHLALPSPHPAVLLWANATADGDGGARLLARLPAIGTTTTDITWLVTAFALHPLHGLGITRRPARLQPAAVSSPLFVHLDLPPGGMRRGETLLVRVVLHNNLPDEAVVADVQLQDVDRAFDLLPPPSANSMPTNAREERIRVPANGTAVASFLLRAGVRSGNARLRATAATQQHVVSAEEALNIRPPGHRDRRTDTLLVDARGGGAPYEGHVAARPPRNSLPTTTELRVEVTGGGPLAVALHAAAPPFDGRLIHADEPMGATPAGPGEPALLPLRVNTLLLDHMDRRAASPSPVARDLLLERLELAYQHVLAHAFADGSFAPFPYQPAANASIWLTALAVVSVDDAARHVGVDGRLVDDALRWLASRQDSATGSVRETGDIMHGPAQKDIVTLTALVALAFRRRLVEHGDAARRALDHVARNLDRLTTAYSVAVASHALHAAGHTARDASFNLLERRAVTNSADGPIKYWTDAPGRNGSLDIETTAYALLVYADRGLTEDAVPVMRYLVRRQNDLGGFASSRDTAIALEALGHAWPLTIPGTTSVRFSHRAKETRSATVDGGVHTTPLPVDARLFNVTVERGGGGLVLFRLVYSYAVNVTGPLPAFALDPRVDRTSDSHRLQLSPCAAYAPRTVNQTDDSDLAAMLVTLPSGWAADVDALERTAGVSSYAARLVRAQHHDTQLVLWWPALRARHETCPTIRAWCTHAVADAQPAPVLLADWYETSRSARVFYRPPGAVSNACDLCHDIGRSCTERWPECEARPVRTGPQRATPEDDGGGAASLTHSTTLLCATVLLALLLLLNH